MLNKLRWLIPVLAGYVSTGWAEPYRAELALQGVSFTVECANEGSLNTLTITPKGLTRDNSVVTVQIDGSVTQAQIADLNADGSPEVYVFTTSAGSGSYGNVVGYAANRKKSLSQIFMPPITDNKAASKGYMGHDRFEIVENRLVRQFPIYLPNDINAQPTSGKIKQVQYRLVAGEAGWILRPYKTFSITLSK